MYKHKHTGILSNFSIDGTPNIVKDQIREIVTVPEILEMIKNLNIDIEKLIQLKKDFYNHEQQSDSPDIFKYQLTYVLYQEYLDAYGLTWSYEEFLESLYKQFDIGEVTDLDDPITNRDKLVNVKLLDELISHHENAIDPHPGLINQLLGGTVFDVKPRFKMDAGDPNTIYQDTFDIQYPLSSYTTVDSSGNVIQATEQKDLVNYNADYPYVLLNNGTFDNLSLDPYTITEGLNDVTSVYEDLYPNVSSVGKRYIFEGNGSSKHKMTFGLYGNFNGYVVIGFDCLLMRDTDTNMSITLESILKCIINVETRTLEEIIYCNSMLINRESITVYATKLNMGYIRIYLKFSIRDSFLFSMLGPSTFEIGFVEGSNTEIFEVDSELLGIIGNVSLVDGSYLFTFKSPETYGQNTIIPSISFYKNNNNSSLSTIRTSDQGTILFSVIWFGEYFLSGTRTVYDIGNLNIAIYHENNNRCVIQLLGFENLPGYQYIELPFPLNEDGEIDFKIGSEITVIISVSKYGAYAKLNDSEIKEMGDMSSYIQMLSISSTIGELNDIDEQSLVEFPIQLTSLLSEVDNQTIDSIKKTIPHLMVNNNYNNTKVYNTTLGGTYKDVLSDDHGTNRVSIGVAVDRNNQMPLARCYIWDQAANMSQMEYLSNSFTRKYRHNF